MDEPEKSIQTLSDIARMSGVSRQVVSAILNPDNNSNIRYSQKTFEKVMKVVKASCYRPNRTAANLVSKRHGSIGVIVKNTGNIPGFCIQFMLDSAGTHNQILSLESLNQDNEKLPLFIREDCVDGLIVFEDLPQSHVKEIRRLKLPCIYVNNNMVSDAESITFNEEDAMDQAVAHLQKRGATKLAYFYPDSSHYSVKSRLRGLENALKRRKLPPLKSFSMGNNFYKGRMSASERKEEIDRIARFLQSCPELQGIVLYSDKMVSLCYGALNRIGKKIPVDMKVLGVGFSSAGLGSDPPLSILRINPKDLGGMLIEEINRKINRKGHPENPMVLPFELLEKESTL